MPEGWKCPNCNRAHGPHVDTCPVPGLVKVQVDKNGTEWHWWQGAEDNGPNLARGSETTIRVYDPANFGFRYSSSSSEQQ